MTCPVPAVASEDLVEVKKERQYRRQIWESLELNKAAGL